MYQEKRPTCITVIGWVWIILGGLMFLSAIMGLFSSIMISQMSQSDPEAFKQTPLFFKFFPLIAIGQMGVAFLGFVSGINFLRLKIWARTVLEVLTWILTLFIFGFMIFWIFNWISMSPGGAPKGFSIMGAVMGVVFTGVYGVPLLIMLKYLRGTKVKKALFGSAEPSA